MIFKKHERKEDNGEKKKKKSHKFSNPPATFATKLFNTASCPSRPTAPPKSRYRLIANAMLKSPWMRKNLRPNAMNIPEVSREISPSLVLANSSGERTPFQKDIVRNAEREREDSSFTTSAGVGPLVLVNPGGGDKVRFPHLRDKDSSHFVGVSSNTQRIKLRLSGMFTGAVVVLLVMVEDWDSCVKWVMPEVTLTE